MMEIKQILCPIDFSEFSVKAYDYAQSVAERRRAQLFVQHIVDLLWSDPNACFVPAKLLRDTRELLVQKGKEQLQEFVENHTHNRIQPEHLVQEGLAADRILAVAQEKDIDLVVMGTHGWRGLSRLMLGSVTERVLRNAPCSVLAVRNPSHDFVVPGNAGNPVLLRRILLCTDFSRPSEIALEHAVSLTEEYDAELTLVYVLEGYASASATEKRAEKAKQQLGQLAPPSLHKKRKIEIIVRIGTAYEQIIQVASEMRSDLVIMGVRGRTTLDMSVFGSTTYRVIQLGPSPVLVVHE